MSETELERMAGVRVGQLLAGKYRIDKILGVGGMGVVVAGHHVHLDDRVAIKFLRPEALMNPDAIARFAREGRAAAKIKSEHIARVSDVGTLENGAPYMVMEYLEGSDLSTWVQQRGALSASQAADFVLQACEAIAEAHSLGIVHRDLKPANLFVVRTPDGTLSAKVLDFGISKVSNATASGSNMTATSAVMGSPLYMSPEQLQSSRDVDARTDIWALGVVLYELVTGRTPFEAPSLPELVYQVMSVAPASTRLHRADVPPGIDAVISRCLEKDRGKRYQTVGELSYALLDFAPKQSKLSVERISRILHAAGMGGSALHLPPSSESIAPPTESIEPMPATQTAAAWGQTALGGGRRAGRAAIAIAVLVVGVIGVGVAARMVGSKSDGGTGAGSNSSPVPLDSALTTEGTTEAAASASASANAAEPLPSASNRPTSPPPPVQRPRGGRPLQQNVPPKSSLTMPPPPPPPVKPPVNPANPWGGRL